jgi:hypothetical protein
MVWYGNSFFKVGNMCTSTVRMHLFLHNLQPKPVSSPLSGMVDPSEHDLECR